jgi:hypothetical protein
LDKYQWPEEKDKTIKILQLITEHVGIGMDLVVEIARDVGQVFRSTAHVLEDRHQVMLRSLRFVTIVDPRPKPR